jgi:DNA-binding NarL/FixJ family response regulator
VTAIRVVLADDHPVVREGLRGMLAAEPDIEVVGEAASGPEAVALAERLRPDVVLMDLRMPGGDGVEATRRLAGTTVVVLTTYDSDADILRAVEAGAAGYLLKDTPRAVLADSVRAAARLRQTRRLRPDRGGDEGDGDGRAADAGPAWISPLRYSRSPGGGFASV